MSIFSEVASPPDPVTTGSADDEVGAERITRGESRSSSELSELPSLSSASPLNRFFNRYITVVCKICVCKDLLQFIPDNLGLNHRGIFLCYSCTIISCSCWERS